MQESILRNKNLYKIFLVSIKYIPSILAFIQMFTILLNYLQITSFALTCIGGTSLILLGLLYLISFLFRFCGLYRLSLNYISLMTFITILDYYVGIPINNECLYKLYGIISGIFILIWTLFLYKNRNNPKIDHIKRLCENYCDCCE